MMPAREDISDLRAGVRFWLFLNGTCGYMVREMHRRREMTRFNLVGDRFAGKKRVSALRTAMVLSMQNVVGAFPRK
uniref:Uncharacterized protein n=1 Tax=Picea glauca TaxID=3330 RepID=A0A101M4Y7_PICGL|nr:hypothetical protein ABT39_MTgene798 [Picea glauca]